MNSSEVGWFSPSIMVVKLPPVQILTSEPVSGSAGVPSNGPSQTPCQKAYSVFPGPNSTSMGILTPAGSSLGLQTLLGQPFTFYDTDVRIPYVHQRAHG